MALNFSYLWVGETFGAVRWGCPLGLCPSRSHLATLTSPLGMWGRGCAPPPHPQPQSKHPGARRVALGSWRLPADGARVDGEDFDSGP